MAFPYMALAEGLAEFLPIIGRWIGGNDGERVAEKIAGVARKVTGQDDPLKILEKLKMDPKLLIEFQHSVLKMENEIELRFLEDRESARSRDVALARAGRGNIRADVMVLAAAFGLVACLLTITYFRGDLPGEAVGIISTIAGIFGACLKDAYAFEFGSSRGSKIKDHQLVEALIAKGR